MDVPLKSRIKLAYKSAMWSLSGRIPLTYFGQSNKGLTAAYNTYANKKGYIDTYLKNAYIQMIINEKANATQNAQIQVKDLQGNLIPIYSGNKYADKVYELFGNPNPLQSTQQFLKTLKIFEQATGEGYVYGNTGVFDFDLMDILTIFPIPSQFMKVRTTGKVFDATRIDQIVEKYEFQHSTYNRDFDPTKILLLSNNNLEFQDCGVTGYSGMEALTREISNIDKSLESRNVIQRKRGALGIFSGGSKDQVGVAPMMPEHKENVQKEFEKYGTGEDQWQYVISEVPLNFQKTAMNVQELGLFEELGFDVLAAANLYNIDPSLVKMWFAGDTFENKKEGEAAMYRRTIIPETKSMFHAINNWLGTANYGIVIEASFSHLEILQTNLKDESERKKNDNDRFESMFKAGAITYGDWMKGIDMTADPDIESKRIWDLDEKQISIILGQTPQSNGTE